MGNVLSIMLSYRLYKESKKEALFCKKRKYGDFLKECEDILNKNQKINDFEKDKISKIE